MSPRTPRAVWRAGPLRPMLGDRELDVYAVNLREGLARDRRLVRALAEDERAKAARFRYERDRARYVAAHVALRVLLGRYLRVKPAEVRFAYGAHGKPHLASQHARSRLTFNLSRSAELALIAVCRGHDIGVDVASLHVPVDPLEISSTMFPEIEHRRLLSIPASRRKLAFLGVWTQKEAYLKAIGTGLERPLDSFCLSETRDGVARLLWDRQRQDAALWRLLALDPAQGYVGAVAVPGEGWRVRWYRV